MIACRENVLLAILHQGDQFWSGARRDAVGDIRGDLDASVAPGRLALELPILDVEHFGHLAGRDERDFPFRQRLAIELYRSLDRHGIRLLGPAADEEEQKKAGSAEAPHGSTG